MHTRPIAQILTTALVTFPLVGTLACDQGLANGDSFGDTGDTGSGGDNLDSGDGDSGDPGDGDSGDGDSGDGDSGDGDSGDGDSGDGDSAIHGTDQDDLLIGTATDDLIYGYAGVDELHGGLGNDTIFGGDQLDVLHGGPGDDQLFGEAGGDVLDGGPGDDLLVGGTGSDTYIHVRGEGSVQIEDVEGAHDRLLLVGYANAEVQLVQEGDDLVVVLPDTALHVIGHYAGQAIEEIRAESGIVPLGADVFAELDVGIYWHGLDGAEAKHIPGRPNPHFDPHKPTLIFTHGWVSGAVNAKRRVGLNWGDLNGPDLDLAQLWIEAGWNIGVFHWEQFADEGEVKDAEAKVWTATGPRAMRWRSSVGGYVDGDMAGRDVSDLFVRETSEALAEIRSGTIRLAGHSLGNQLVTEGAARLWAVSGTELSKRLMPGRVALLDGFWSKGGKGYLAGQSTGEAARDRADALIAEGVVLEALRSSPVANNPFIGDTNAAMFDKLCFTELRPWYYGPFAFENKHRAAAWHYLWTIAFPAPADGEGGWACSAATDDAATAAGMGVPHHWFHAEGHYTMSPEDDVYERVN